MRPIYTYVIASSLHYIITTYVTTTTGIYQTINLPTQRENVDIILELHIIRNGTSL